jgi:hypothetical protein
MAGNQHHFWGFPQASYSGPSLCRTSTDWQIVFVLFLLFIFSISFEAKNLTKKALSFYLKPPRKHKNKNHCYLRPHGDDMNWRTNKPGVAVQRRCIAENRDRWSDGDHATAVESHSCRLQSNLFLNQNRMRCVSCRSIRVQNMYNLASWAKYYTKAQQGVINCL